MSDRSTAQAPATRWLQLAIGIVCMVMIANLQYGWTLFVTPIDQKYHWGRAAIQVAFSIFVITETWLVPIEGWFVDRFGPKIVVLIGGILVGIAWAMNSVADSLTFLYIAAAIGGVGAGAVYGTCIGNALKWFPDRRGLGRWPDRGGLRRGIGDHHHPDPEHDRRQRISRRRSCGSASARASSCSSCPSRCAPRAAVRFRHRHASRSRRAATRRSR